MLNFSCSARITLIQCCMPFFLFNYLFSNYQKSRQIFLYRQNLGEEAGIKMSFNLSPLGFLPYENLNLFAVMQIE